jgi:hypothetical protein
MAEQTTTSRSARSRHRPTRSATLAMCAVVANELPPYFWTSVRMLTMFLSLMHSRASRLGIIPCFVGIIQ